MFNYTCLNPIAGVGLDLFSDDYKKVDDIKDADAALVRSAAMHDMELGDKVLAVARAGAGVNNIPLDKCAEQGIVVFNTPGVTKHIMVISVAVSATERDRDTGTSRERGKLVLAQLTTGIPASLQGL